MVDTRTRNAEEIDWAGFDEEDDSGVDEGEGSSELKRGL